MPLLSRCRRVLYAAALVAALAPRVDAQEPTAADSARRADLVRVFIDCPRSWCDLDYFRREIAFVDHVRDRADADVHILLTEQGTGGGGRAYAATFIGLRRFAGRVDTLRFFARQDATEDARRAGLARIFKVGLLPFVLGTPAADAITIAYIAPTGGESGAAQGKRDPWNLWAFRASANTFFDGESSYNSLNLYGSLSASRTTEALKLSLSLNGDYSESNFEIDSTLTVTSTSKSYGANALFARSIGGQFSAGAQASARRSTYSNTKLGLRFAPGIEYDVFPYSQSARRLLTVRYQVGMNRLVYDSTTIFEKDSETLLDESLQISLDATQPWGSSGVGINGSHYFDDFSKNSLRLFGNVNVRLVRGLSFRLNGSISRVRDQRYLPKGDLSPEEVLLRRRAVATDYRYFGSMGFSYSFGSIFNNVVNPRFGGSGDFYED